MTHKYKVGQRCILLPARTTKKRYRSYVGAMVTITKLVGYSPIDGMPAYTIDKPALRFDGTPSRFLLKVSEPHLHPIDDKPEAGDWEVITKLLGTDIRRERQRA